MDPITTAAVIGAGANLISGFFGRKSQKKAQQTNIDQQREFAQHGIRWKVADAKAAGLHPLAALGANTVSFSPTAVGQDYSDIRAAGQNISRAVAAKLTPAERELQLLQLQQEKAKLENMNLQNVGLRKQLQDIISVPPIPGGDGGAIPGQGSISSNTTLVRPEIKLSDSIGTEAGLPPGEINNILPGGFILRGPNDTLSEGMEGSLVVSSQYGAIRVNQYAKALALRYLQRDRSKFNRFVNQLKPKTKLPPNHYYKYYPLLGMFRIVEMPYKTKSSHRPYRMKKSH